MELLNWVLFESTVVLSLVIGLALFFLLVYWRRTLRPRPLVIGLAIGAALLVMQSLVVTNREQALQIMGDVARDLTANRADALAAALAPDFATESMDRGEFVAFVRRQLEIIRIHTADSTGMRVVDSSDGRFDVLASYLSHVTSPSLGPLTTPSTWKIGFERIGDRWLIRRIEPVEIGQFKMRDWNHVGELR